MDQYPGSRRLAQAVTALLSLTLILLILDLCLGITYAIQTLTFRPTKHTGFNHRPGLNFA